MLVMAVEKLSVSLAPEEIAWVRRKADETSSNVSAVLSEAVRQQRRMEALDALLDELGTGDITVEDVVAVIAEWSAAGTSP
jgi:K+/H+ antiporter YhaU regulatory subunit KhtT